MYGTFIWEIKGNIFMGVSESPFADFHKLEIILGCQASRAFSTPESSTLLQYLVAWKGKVPKNFRFCIHEPFLIGKEFLLSKSIKYAPHITPYI